MVNLDIEDKKIKDKRKNLRELQKHCITQSNHYRKRYKRLKMKDNICDVSATVLNFSAMSMALSSITFPPLLIACGACSGLGLIITQGQRTYNSKVKLTNYNVACLQYEELGREINAVLLRNHCTSKEYLEYIEDVNAKLNMINDSRIL
jgi:hypothetical protein